jgi:hypothetical protein
MGASRRAFDSQPANGPALSVAVPKGRGCGGFYRVNQGFAAPKRKAAPLGKGQPLLENLKMLRRRTGRFFYSPSFPIAAVGHTAIISSAIAS